MKTEHIKQLRHFLDLIEEYSDDINRGMHSVGNIKDLDTELDLVEHAMYRYLQNVLDEDKP